MGTIYKTYPFAVKEIADRTLEFVGSTEDLDRDGEVVEVAGWQTDNYMKNPVFMWAHDYKEPPIGKALKVWKRDGQLKFNIEFAPKETYEFADTIYKLYKGGFLNATSVGFMPDLDSIVEGDGVKTPRKTYKKQELLELSGVPIPSNTNALRNAIDTGVITIKEFQGIKENPYLPPEYKKALEELITKPEETENYIRIPVDSGNHEGHRIRTIVISEKEGIKAIYCGTDKVVMTYLFSKDKGWDMAKARAWVKAHEKKSINELVEHPISQEEIIDEFDYISELLATGAISDKAKPAMWILVKEILRLAGDDIPDEIKNSIQLVKPTPTPGTLTNSDILEAIKRIAKT